jgi:hypothetical protein
VIEQHVPRHAAELHERLAHAPDQRLGVLAFGEPYPARSAEGQRRRERRQRLATAPDHGGVGLHLLTRCRLEAHHRLGPSPPSAELTNASSCVSSPESPRPVISRSSTTAGIDCGRAASIRAGTYGSNVSSLVGLAALGP